VAKEMPAFPCKQHSDFRGASQRRKHINMLLLDGCEEAIRIRQPAHGSGGIERDPCSRDVLQRNLGAANTGQSAQTKTWCAAYKEGGQSAADLARQVGNKRTLAGQCFGLANPALPNRVQKAGCVPNMELASVTQVCL
jgi:hypothetical protein